MEEVRMTIGLTRIGKKARENPRERFNSIYHFLYDLTYGYSLLNRDSAPGVDGVTVIDYGQDLAEKLTELAGRLARRGYRPQAVLRRYIEKPGSDKLRPLGIPTTEDKVVQMALTRLLEQIYEEDFLDCSYGYRPKRSCHQLLDRLGRILQQQPIYYVVEADIKGFFDHVNHEWMRKFLGVRIADERVLRLVDRFLKGGILENGLTKSSEEGTPQGGVLSPLLSNVYLHYALDLWFEKRFKKSCQGEAYYFRYADDFLACFEDRQDAERFYQEVGARLGQFHLEIEPAKTKLIEWRKPNQPQDGTPEKEDNTFTFLGFQHYVGKTRYGDWKLKRRTSTKKFRTKLREIADWLKQNRNRYSGAELIRRMKSRLTGYLQYYAITDNTPRCWAFDQELKRLLFKWLNRRSQRLSYNWEGFTQALKAFDWPLVRCKHNLSSFRALTNPT
jgi:group II intron reverse transcriptase/maturase